MTDNDDPDARIYAVPLDRYAGIEYLPDAPEPEDGPDDYVGPVIGSQTVVRTDGGPTPWAPGHIRWCATCSCLVPADTAEWRHGGHTLESPDPAAWDSLGQEMAERIAAGMHATRLHKFLEWGPNEWRPIPAFPNYEINGYTREVRRPARTATLKNGQTRQYPAKEIHARKSSVTLSHEGKASSHGIDKLWRDTFPEYMPNPNSWQVHSLRTEYIPGELGRVIQKTW